MKTITDPKIISLHSRAEVALTCPGCGKTGSLRRIGGGEGASRFRCEGYRYDPTNFNYCRFVFTVSDKQLARFR